MSDIIKKKWTPITLRALKETHPKILNEFEALAKPYCTRLFDLGEEYKGIPDFIGSGTFVRIEGRPGILTNHHVAMVFGVKNRCWVYVPGYKSEKIEGLRLKSIISLPHYPADWEVRGLDISFIELDSEAAVQDLGYQIWDLDKSAKNHFSNKLNLKRKGAVNNWLWGFEATPSEKVSKQGNTLCFEQAGFHFLGPDKPDFFEAIARNSKGDFLKRADEFYCEINREGIDGPILPNSWGGTSGSAVWKGIGETPSETISNFDLAGVQAEEIRWVGPAVAVVFRGTVSLYDTFYKFCSHYLLHQEEVAALKHAGFVNKEFGIKSLPRSGVD